MIFTLPPNQKTKLQNHANRYKTLYPRSGKEIKEHTAKVYLGGNNAKCLWQDFNFGMLRFNSLRWKSHSTASVISIDSRCFSVLDPKTLLEILLLGQKDCLASEKRLQHVAASTCNYYIERRHSVETINLKNPDYSSTTCSGYFCLCFASLWQRLMNIKCFALQ